MTRAQKSKATTIAGNAAATDVPAVVAEGAIGPQGIVSYALSVLRQPRLGEYLRQQRMALGLRTYDAVAEASELPESMWVQVEKGRNIQLSTLVRLLEFLERRNGFRGF